MEVPENLLYSKEHEWIEVNALNGTIGITAHAQKELGDVVYVDLPEIGQVFSVNQVIANVESVKAVSEVYCPVACEVTEINSALVNSPQLVNESPYTKAWLIKIRLANPDDLENLLTATQYRKFLTS